MQPVALECRSAVVSCVLCFLCLQRKQQHDADERETNFQALYAEVLDGLGNGGGILHEVQEVLDYADAVHDEQQRELYQQWNSQVFEKIQV